MAESYKVIQHLARLLMQNSLKKCDWSCAKHWVLVDSLCFVLLHSVCPQMFIAYSRTCIHLHTISVIYPFILQVHPLL